MGMLHNGHYVWLRSPVSPYLHAKEDRASRCTRAAHRRKQRSRCTCSPATSSTSFPTALAADTSASPAPTGHHGVQLDFDQAEVEAIMWQVVMSETGDNVLLRHVSGRFLSAIGRYQWHNGSIVDNSTMVV